MDSSTAGPPKLRRSCQACVRGKRRCDQRWPHCSRCQTRRINCEYINVPLTMEKDSKPVYNAQGVARFAPHQVSGTSALSIRPSLPLEIQKRFEKSIISFLVEGLRSYPSSFAENMKTHFIHPEFWSHGSAPLPIRDMYALCQLHAQPKHHPMLLALLTQRVVSLRKQISRAANFEDLLAAVQALLLALCMLIVNEHPSVPYSEAVSDMLFHLGHKLWQQAPIQLPSTLSPRRAWLFAESVRRTIIVAFVMRSVYSLKKRNYSVRTPFIDSLPFDTRTALWDCGGEARVGVAGQPADSIVSLHQYSSMMDSGMVHGISGFGELIFAACKGRIVEDIPYPSISYIV